jgi:hypothetical protein
VLDVLIARSALISEIVTDPVGLEALITGLEIPAMNCVVAKMNATVGPPIGGLLGAVVITL